jgi:M3 family oligoendopeptidase
MNTSPPFSELTCSRPAPDDLDRDHTARLSAWDAADSASEQIALITAWDRDQIQFNTNAYLAMIHYSQNTQDSGRRETKEFFDDLDPTVLGHNLLFLRRVTDSAHRGAFEAHFGPQIFAIWDRFLRSFSVEIADDKREESRIQNDYAAMLAGLEIELDGQKHTLSTLRALYGHSDRTMRRRALQAADGALGALQDRMDGLYADLVGLRHGMARKLGYETFTPLGYARMQRIGYGPADVERFRQQVRSHVVPLAQRIYRRRASQLGLTDFAFEDEEVRDHRGVPCPMGGHDWMMDRAAEMFGLLGPDFATFFDMMRRQERLDLKSRPGKRGGGFCCDLPAYGLPFILANFNGTRDDVRVFTHEVGHAFQNHSASHLPLVDYHWPTTEAAEIHSMSLEYLTLPHMELFFGDDANRFRMDHLEGGILFLPYGVAIDDFQHRIYAEPDASADRRAEIWTEVESIYLPHRVYRDMPYFATGRVWQRQRHVYHNPFYYIDYCLAGTCAMQFWRASQGDRQGTLERYRALCKLGGSLPFTGLLNAVGLQSPFEDGCLADVCDGVANAIEI